MKNAVTPVPNTDALSQAQITAALALRSAANVVAGIAVSTQPKSLSDHLLAIFMAVVADLHESNAPMPVDVRALLHDIHQAAHCPNAAHALELHRAIVSIGKHPGLLSAPSVRIVLAQANYALLSAMRS